MTRYSNNTVLGDHTMAELLQKLINGLQCPIGILVAYALSAEHEFRRMPVWPFSITMTPYVSVTSAGKARNI